MPLVIDDITAVWVHAERAGIDAWPVAFAMLFSVTGLAMVMEVHEATGWIVGAGLVLAAAGLCLSARKWRYRLIVAHGSGNVEVAMSCDPCELEEAQRRIEQRIVEHR